MEQLINKLKNEIIEALNLTEMTPESIDENAPLFVEGLGLDSIDALELIVLLEKKYGLKLATSEDGKKVLQSVKSMAEFIRANSKG
jgi:acyl carrier protein